MKAGRMSGLPKTRPVYQIPDEKGTVCSDDISLMTDAEKHDRLRLPGDDRHPVARSRVPFLTIPAPEMKAVISRG